MICRFFSELYSILCRGRYFLAALIIPLVARSIPEVLAGPYPLGLDTLRYIPYIQNGWVFSLAPAVFLKSSNLFYVFAAFPNWLFNNAFLAIKVLGPLLLAVLSIMVYLYAKRALSWSNRKSLLVSILVSTYFVSLRISWDLYRQTLGFIFLVAVFMVLKSSSSRRRYVFASALMVLTILSHELAAVTLFFVVVAEALGYLLKKQKRSFSYLVAASIIPGVMFLLRMYYPERASFVVPLVYAASEPSLTFASEVFGLMLYCYVLLLPFVVLGFGRLKDSFLRLWVLLCVGIPVLTLLYPSASLPYWNRWVYLLVYPLTFFAVEGFVRVWRMFEVAEKRFRRLVPKVFAAVYLGLLLTTSGLYLTLPAEHPFPYFSQYNPFLNHVPSSLLQTTVSAGDASSLVGCLVWLNQSVPGDAVVVSHFAVFDWVRIYLRSRTLVSLPVEALGTSMHSEASYAEDLVAAAQEASVNGSVPVFTVWWISGEGWYQISSLPSAFVEIHREGRMAVYEFVPVA